MDESEEWAMHGHTGDNHIFNKSKKTANINRSPALSQALY